MTSELVAAAAHGDEKAWSALTEALSPRVWTMVSPVSDFGRAVDAGSVVFHRLADECTSMQPADIDSWLADTVDVAVNQAEAAGWRLATPALEPVDGVPSTLADAAGRAYRLRAGSRQLATPVGPGEDVTGEARGVTVAWRAPGDPASLPLPAAVWNGRFRVGEIGIDLTLLVAEERRLLGSVWGMTDVRARLRDSGTWHQVDPNGRFRIGGVPEAPLSVEVAGESGVVVTPWWVL